MSSPGIPAGARPASPSPAHDAGAPRVSVRTALERGPEASRFAELLGTAGPRGPGPDALRRGPLPEPEPQGPAAEWVAGELAARRGPPPGPQQRGGEGAAGSRGAAGPSVPQRAVTAAAETSMVAAGGGPLAGPAAADGDWRLGVTGPAGLAIELRATRQGAANAAGATWQVAVSVAGAEQAQLASRATRLGERLQERLQGRQVSVSVQAAPGGEEPVDTGTGSRARVSGRRGAGHDSID